MEWLNLATVVFLRFVVVMLKLAHDLFWMCSIRCVDILMHHECDVASGTCDRIVVIFGSHGIYLLVCFDACFINTTCDVASDTCHRRIVTI